MATRLFHPLAALLRIASRVICLIVAVSFVIFAVNQTGSASIRQQDELNGTPVAAATAPTSTRAPRPHEAAVHRVIDEAAEALTSPFSGVTAGSSSQWAIRGVGTVLALLVYGLGLGYLARVLRVRV
jgi:hypothetical protein